MATPPSFRRGCCSRPSCGKKKTLLPSHIQPRELSCPSGLISQSPCRYSALSFAEALSTLLALAGNETAPQHYAATYRWQAGSRPLALVTACHPGLCEKHLGAEIASQGLSACSDRVDISCECRRGRGPVRVYRSIAPRRGRYHAPLARLRCCLRSPKLMRAIWPHAPRHMNL